MDFKAVVARLRDEDLPRIGYSIGVGEDPIHAFLDVETSGGGYDDKGRLKALYEPHRAYKNAGRVSTALRDRFVKAGLAYLTWGTKPYPADSYPRIVQACAIDETVALLSTSWGIGQVLGENFKAAGYGSVQEMLRAYLSGGEAEQLDSAVRFIKANGLDKHLRERNWTAFATGYNGPAQAKNGYAAKLEARYRFWAAKPDTVWSPASAVKAAIPMCEACGKRLAA